jgi:hypothetical protein
MTGSGRPPAATNDRFLDAKREEFRPAVGQLWSGPSGRYGSTHDRPSTHLAAAKLPLTLNYPEAVLRDRLHPTRCRRRRFSQRATGLLRNLTVARAVEKLSDGDSGPSNVGSTRPEEVPGGTTACEDRVLTLPKCSRHRLTTAQTRPFSKAVGHDLAESVGTRRRPYVGRPIT